MGMHTYVVGLVPPDEQWQKMKTVYDSCVAAGIDVPVEVEHFFDGRPPDPAGHEVEIESREWSDDDARAGLEVELRSLPQHVKVVRFINSW